MAKTPCDLFRAGNKSGPKMDYVRPADITMFTHNGMAYAKGRGGGVSTFRSKDPALSGTWWLLPAGTDYDDKLLFLNDDGTGHIQWEPNQDMPVSAFEAILATLNGKFTLTP
jgi:hypothetical protein